MQRMKLGHVAISIALLIVACGGRVEEPVDHRVVAAAADVPGTDRPSTPTRLPPEGDDSSSSLSTATDPCPERPPSELDWCPRPYKCKYQDSCSQRPPLVASSQTYECVASRWTRVSSKYTVVCPRDVPIHGSACEIDCAYPSPCHYETACGDAWATCEAWNGTWHLTGSACAIGDAGAPSPADAGASGD